MVSLYVVGLVLGLLRVAIGLQRLSLIKGRATAVPAAIEAELVRIATQLGVRRSFQLRQSDDIQTPCLVGTWRPTILVPPAQCNADNAAELPSVLAHELAHLRGNDLAWNDLFAGLAILLWFHPLAWRMRRAHADTCDEVSDAIAADYTGDGENYGRTLARLALRVHNPAAVPGLAMARPSGIRRRVEAIQRHVFRYALPRYQAAMAVTVFATTCIFLGALAITRSAAQTPNDQSPTKSTEEQQLVIRAIEDKSGKALSNVEIELHGTIGGKRIRDKRTTQADGTAVYQWKAGARVNDFWFTAKKSPFVPINYWWMGDHENVELPATLDLRFQPGQLIGGIVRDETGQPVANGSVELSMPITWPRRPGYVFTVAEMKTDAAGRWKFDGAPADVSSLSLRAKRSGYMPASMSATRSMDNVLTLKKGLQIEGEVVDRELKPIKGARAALGFDRFGSNDPAARCDENGHFILKNCKPGRSLVTIQADGFSPQAKEVVIGDKNKALFFVLEPGHTLRARVVDSIGKPIKGAFFAADTWRGHRSLQFRVDTPEDGRVAWKSAPADTVICDMGKSGYMSARNVAIKPDAEEQTVTMYPVLEISGSVTDKRAHEPIKNFQVIHGYQFHNSSQTYWSRDEAVTGKDSKYKYKFDEPMKGYFLQAVAPGYRPATSRMFECTEGKVTYDFELESGNGPSGVVLLPEGKPAAGAQVGLATKERHAMLEMGRFDRRQNQLDVVETDAAGRFTFVPQADENFILIALHDSGFAQLTSDQLKSSPEVKLEPWGRVEGQVLVGKEPDIDREVSFQPTQRQAIGSEFGSVFSYGYTTKTDKTGKFAMERVMPGPGSICRVVVTEFIRSQQHAPGWQQSIDVHPNETANVSIGGTGRPVTGQLVISGNAGAAIDWTTNEPVSIEPVNDSKGGRASSYVRYLGNLDKSGRFTIPDVPAGDYKLRVSVNNPPVPNACGAGEAIGKAEHSFSIPEIPKGRSDQPLDLGQINAELFDTLDVGEIAPDFVAERLGGGRTRLADLRGKLVLVDFWATWCQPCIAEMPALKEIQQSFGSNPRFALLGVSCDDDAAAAKKFVDDNGLNWHHVNVKGTSARAPKDYTVRALPATFLVGPNGRVIAKYLRGEDLKKAIAAALSDEKLLREAIADRPPRFPVVRFEAPADSNDVKAKAALVIADDSDPDFEKNKPHSDGVRMLSANGSELWSASGLNNCQTVGGVHGVAIDRERGRVFVRELVANRVTAYSLTGHKLWQVEKIQASAMAVDPKTGNLWVTGGDSLKEGETVVLDLMGNEVATYPVVGVDMDYDPHSDSFWLVGYELIKLNRRGEVQFRKSVDGWCCASVSINPTDGGVWIAERIHPDVARSKNRLWLLASDGTVRLERDLKSEDIFIVACDPKSADAWFGGYSEGLRRAMPSGTVTEPLPIKVSSVAISPTTGDLWVSTEDEVLKLDHSGRAVTKIPHRGKSSQAWMAAF
jgi:beta-lactamase regulating signal transducer with metallopeptidase domain/thiol-disulfide isomerase/thioredoxin